MKSSLVRSPSPAVASNGAKTVNNTSTFSTLVKTINTSTASAADPTPVRRQELPKEERPFATALPPLEPEPPGPSPDTVLHDVPVSMQQFIQNRGKSQGAQPPAVSISRNVPARVRANPQRTGATPQPTAAPQGRPPSAGQAASQRSASTLTNFDEEMEEVRRMHSLREEEETAASNGGRGGRNSSMGGSVTFRGRSPSPFGATEAAMNPDDFETVEGEDADASSTATGKPIYVPYTPDLRAKLGASTTLHTHVSQKPMVLRDYQLLAETCQRAGRARTEGHAYYKIGEILSKNKRDTLPKSVMFFKRYLNISRRLNDLQGEAKALNCLGIVHYELGGSNNMHIALEYHRQHAEIADAAGIFIANTNMGLAHAKLGDFGASIECHKQALQYAVRAGDKAAESLALANLGLAGAKQGDTSTARVCVERHLELVTTLRDDSAACEAYEQLGVLAIQRGDFSSASENLLLALDVAVRGGDQEKAKQLRCQVGFVQGMLRLDEQMRSAAGLMGN